MIATTLRLVHTGLVTLILLIHSPALSAESPDLSFDLLPEQKATPALDPVQQALLGKKVATRRAMLTTHQIVGFATLAALASTVVIGHLNYHDKYVSGDFTGRYKIPHLSLSITTTTLFGTTGLLALFAPNPYPKPVKLDTALLHKVAMALATCGMVTQIILGPLAVSRVGHNDQAALGLAHVVTGYTTLGFMATGVISYMF